MDNGDAIALQLQFREHTTPAAPPDVDAFRRPRRATRPALAPEELGVLPPTRARARERGGFVVFFQHPEFGIPAPGHLYALIDLTSWSPRLTMLGYAANIRPSREEPGLLRAAGVLAACLTLAIPFDVAAAPAPGDDVVASA
ncbi:MAG: hypothetical protein KC468_17285, partial [Myxococcales bacterium]|nr:hypothetical protein [Myxococcales bacterium]